MVAELTCGICGEELVVDDAQAAELTHCPKCGASLRPPEHHVPAPDEVSTGGASTHSPKGSFGREFRRGAGEGLALGKKIGYFIGLVFIFILLLSNYPTVAFILALPFLLIAVLFVLLPLIRMIPPSGCPPLHKAAAVGSRDRVEELVRADPGSVDSRDKRDRTPLHHAAGRNRVDVVRTLLAHGADVNARDADGDTALHCAALQNFPAVIDVLLEHGAMPNAKNKEGSTPIVEAALMNAKRAARVLLERGADPRVGRRDGKSAAQWARGLEHTSMLRMLQNHGGT